MTHFCRHCGSLLEHEVIDLGYQPPSNAYLKIEQLSQPELTYPLKLFVCKECWLVQLPAHASADTLFTSDYAYFSSTSSSWCTHAQKFVEQAVRRLELGTNSHVVEIASNDGYLLQFVQQRGISCVGIEPTHATAQAARAKGIITIEEFFGLDLAANLEKADLVVANNVLAHVPDINDFVAGIARLLKPKGVASLEFPHLLRLLECNQFDTIYHEHFSYLSLQIVEKICECYGLIVFDVEQLSTHGGSLRVWLALDGSGRYSSKAVHSLREMEVFAGLQSFAIWAGFQRRAQLIKNELLSFLIHQYDNHETIMGYGAAAKGNTLLNYAGVRSDLLPAVADQSLSKQGKFLPGSHIPIISPEHLAEYNPQKLLVLPWNLFDEVSRQWPNKTLVTAIPGLSVRT